MGEKEDIQRKFSVGLKSAMKKKGLSMRKLAAAAGLEYAHVQRIASGKVNIELSTIIALAEGLEISPSELFSYYH